MTTSDDQRTHGRAGTAKAAALAALAFVCALNSLASADPGASASAALEFSIAAGELADSLDRFAEQSGLQIVYRAPSTRGMTTRAVVGRMAPRAALDRMLAGTGLEWDYVNEATVVLRRSSDGKAAPRTPEVLGAAASTGVAGLSDLNVVHDPRRTLPSEPSAAAFGLSKPLMTTPRAVSTISSETIDLLGLSAVEDLVRVVPGVYTTTRWGIQGSIDVRGVPADTYFRGMKRLNLQGHGRTVLAAMDAIEVVKGPPSPLYGMGKIGGYTNMVPRSVRAETGSYLAEPQGFAQMVVGSFEKSEMSFGIGGPLPTGRRQGGYYVYGLVEDSDSYVEQVPIDQRVLQASMTLDDFIGDYRLEAGVSLQRSRTAGALIGRFTQDVVDGGRYIRGLPLVDLDANGNGRIGYLEMHERSPVAGDVASGNRPLHQYWAWPTDAAGAPLPLDRFPVVAGIPQTLYDYLLEHPAADPTGLLRAQGPGGPLPISGRVPLGFALDPASVAFDGLDVRRPAALERELEADFATLYVDLIDDGDGLVTVKNQLFFDSMQQYKLSEQPFSQRQDVYVVEDKLTATRSFDGLPGWIDVNGVATANARYTSSQGDTQSGDYGTHRNDAMHGGGSTPSMTPFATSLLHERLDDDGMPWTSRYATESLELGVGLLVDAVLHGRTRLTVGARFDRSKATNVDYAGTLSLAAGTAEDPAVFQSEDRRASRWDGGVSWSVSASRQLPHNVHAYVTLAESTLALDGNNNKYHNDVIEHGHIGKARLAEVGVKAGLLDDKLYFAAAAYDQARRGASPDDPSAVLNAHASATSTEGWEAELKWVPAPNLIVSFYALRQTTRYRPNDGGPIMVDARALGFQDVVDAQGNVVYPAEALLYGGRAFLVLPSGVDDYDLKHGNPEAQQGFLAQYELDNGVGFTLSGNYFSSTYAGRLALIELPEAQVVNAGVYWSVGDWHVKCDVWNAFDERFFRARTGDSLGDVLVSAMPGRRWQAAFKVRF